MENKTISIIILNWNGKKILKKCLDSVKSQTFKNFETILVDNASEDGSQEFLRKDYPWVKLVENKKNFGYAKGNNIGIRSSKGEYVLILNNDTVLDRNFLKELDNCKNKADILGVKNYFYDKKEIFWAVGAKLNKFTMRASLIGNKEKDNGQYDNADIEYTVGSAIFVDRKVFDKIGYLNEEYFCYYEETEWQTRALNKGFKIALCPKAKLWHRVAYSTGGGKSPLSAYYLVRNRGYYIKKWAPYKIIAYPYWMIEIIARFLYGLLKGKLTFSKMSLKGMISFFNGKKSQLN